MAIVRMNRGERIASGIRDKWVEIEQQPAVPAGGGYPEEAWTSLAFAWMSRTDLRGDERFLANQDLAQVESQWEMPYRADMDPEAIDVPATRRLRFRGRIYNILAGSLLDRRLGVTLITVVKA